MCGKDRHADGSRRLESLVVEACQEQLLIRLIMGVSWRLLPQVATLTIRIGKMETDEK